MKSKEKRQLGTSASAGAGEDSAGWLRARRPEHKLERRESILSAARGLLDDDGVEGATLSAIAREAGLSKANCYRYFESREAILLAIILDEARAWAVELDDRLHGLSRTNDIDEVVEVFVRTTVERPRLCMLFSSLWSVLERNVAVESIAHFKRSFIEVAMKSVESVDHALPSMSSEDAYAFINFFFFFVAGSWSAAHPSPIVVEVLEREEFAGHCIDFPDLLQRHTRTLLSGMQTG